jgi:hypothetical protein
LLKLLIDPIIFKKIYWKLDAGCHPVRIFAVVGTAEEYNCIDPSGMTYENIEDRASSIYK